MATHPHSPQLRAFPILVVSLLVAVQACVSFPRGGVQPHVKVVKVIKVGDTLRVRPDHVIVKRSVDIVVWSTNGDSINIEFKPRNQEPVEPGNRKPVNPFTDLSCKGRFCGVLVPAADTVPYGHYYYKVTVDGIVVDPEVEIQG